MQCERIPALALPALTDAATLEHDVLTTEFAEVVAHRQAGLTTADHDGLDVLMATTAQLAARASRRLAWMLSAK